MCLIRPCPPPSAGCAFPVKTNCIGHFSLLTILDSLSKSVNRRCARLYVAKRRPKPINNAFVLIFSINVTTFDGSPWFFSQLSRYWSLMYSINLCLSALRISQMSLSGTCWMASQIALLDWSLKKLLSKFFAQYFFHSVAIHVGRCTPLVT